MNMNIIHEYEYEYSPSMIFQIRIRLCPAIWNMSTIVYTYFEYEYAFMRYPVTIQQRGVSLPQPVQRFSLSLQPAPTRPHS